MSDFDFPQLDGQRVYVGKRLNERGERTYLDALSDSLKTGTPSTLQDLLEPVPGDLWIESIIAINGRTSTTPYTAPATLAEGEFNRYYMRAICLRALAEGDGQVTVRRGKAVSNPRSDPSVKVKERDVLDANAVLEDIRRHLARTPNLECHGDPTPV